MPTIEFEAGALLSGHSSAKRGNHRTMTYSAIVKEARGVLQCAGTASFSLLKVAVGACVPRRTLQHYFLNRTLLLGAVVTQTVGSANKGSQAISRSEFPAAQGLALLVDQSLHTVMRGIGRTPPVGLKFGR